LFLGYYVKFTIQLNQRLSNKINFLLDKPEIRCIIGYSTLYSRPRPPYYIVYSRYKDTYALDYE
jgi:hypothetical protein